MKKIILSITLLMLVFAHYANAYEKERFCSGLGGHYDNKTKYYSAVFKSDYVSEYSKQFADFVEKKYDVTYLSLSTCIENGRERESKMKNNPYKVVDTNWQPDNFETQELQDFHINVPSNNREVQICVRDHECEDGDKIEVSVNGDAVFRGEIDNDWDCNTVDVDKGRNTIRLYAINGTGHKGDCSYADTNTGEMKVSGSNTQSQQWRHRGGKGSSADIVVDID